MWKTVIKNLIFFTVNTDRTSPSQFVNHNIFKILNHSSPCILGNNIITYLLMYWIWWIAINVDLKSLFRSLRLNDMAQAFIYLLSLPNFMNSLIFHGFPYISWISIYFMVFHIFSWNSLNFIKFCNYQRGHLYFFLNISENTPKSFWKVL